MQPRPAPARTNHSHGRDVLPVCRPDSQRLWCPHLCREMSPSRLGAPGARTKGQLELSCSHRHICPEHSIRTGMHKGTDSLCRVAAGRCLKMLLAFGRGLGAGLWGSPAAGTSSSSSASFTHRVAPTTAVCRRCTSSAASPARHLAGKEGLQGQNPWDPAREVAEGPGFSSSL